MRLFIKYLDPTYPVLDLLRRTNRFNESDTKGLIDPFLVNNEDKADVYLIAHDAIHFGHSKNQIIELERLSTVKPVILFDCGDYPINIKLKNVISLRTNFPPNEDFYNAIAIPYNVKSRAHLPIREFKTLPTISFAGFAPRVISRRLIPKSFNAALHPIINNGSIVRFFGIRKISKFNNKILIVRNHYGGARSLIEDLPKFESEYEESINNSDFVFTPRGDANQSARYFEVLSAGRVPILPDTSAILPRLIYPNYSPIALTVNATSNNLGAKVEEFWISLNPRKWQEIQTQNRATFAKNYDFRIFMTNLFSSTFEQFLEYVISANDSQEGILSEK